MTDPYASHDASGIEPHTSSTIFKSSRHFHRCRLQLPPSNCICDTNKCYAEQMRLLPFVGVTPHNLPEITSPTSPILSCSQTCNENKKHSCYQGLKAARTQTLKPVNPATSRKCGLGKTLISLRLKCAPLNWAVTPPISHTFIGMYFVYTVILAGIHHTQSYTVCIYSSGQPYKCARKWENIMTFLRSSEVWKHALECEIVKHTMKCENVMIVLRPRHTLTRPGISHFHIHTYTHTHTHTHIHTYTHQAGKRPLPQACHPICLHHCTDHPGGASGSAWRLACCLQPWQIIKRQGLR